MKKIIVLFLILFNTTFIFGLAPNFLNKDNYYNQIIDIGILDDDLNCSFMNIKILDVDQVYFNKIFALNEINKIENIFDRTVSSNLVVIYETLDELTNVIDTFMFPLYLEDIDLGTAYLCDAVTCVNDGTTTSLYFFNKESKIFLNINNDFNNIIYSLKLYAVSDSITRMLFVEDNAAFPYTFYNLDVGDYQIVINYVFEDKILFNNLYFNISNLIILKKEPEENNIFYPMLIYDDYNHKDVYEHTNAKNIINDSDNFNNQKNKDTFFVLQNRTFYIFIFLIFVFLFFVIFNKKKTNKRERNRRQNKFFFLLILFFLIVCNLLFVFSDSLNLDIDNTEQTNLILDYYRLKQNYPKSISVVFELTEDNVAKTSIIENYKIIPYDNDNILREPVIDSLFSNNYENDVLIYYLNTELKSVYFFNNIKKETLNTVSGSCYDVVKSYYKTVAIPNKLNLENEQEIIRNYLIPRTKEIILKNINENDLKQATDCFVLLLNEKILTPYDILLYTKIELKNTSETPNSYQSIETVTFEPKFLSSIKDIDFIISFKKTPYVIASEYSMPFGCDKEDNEHCYITKSDLALIKQTEQAGSIISIESAAKRENYFKYLRSFELIENLNKKKVSNIFLTELLVFAAMKRENYCFSENKFEYNKIIFDVAKAYNLTNEQALQLWAIIAEKSNCNINYFSDSLLFGLPQINLNDYYNNYYDGSDIKVPAQLKEKEYIEYLNFGNFSNINKELITKYGIKEITRYGGSQGKINSPYWYYEFLIKAIKTNEDKYGSLILYTGANYLKKMITLVNFCNDYTLENNILNQYFNYDAFLFNDTKKNMIGIFMLSNIIDKEVNQKELENICKIIGDKDTLIIDKPIILTDKTGVYCIDNGYIASKKYPTGRTITLPGSNKSKTYNGSGSLLYKLLDNGKVDTCVPGTSYTELVVNPPKDLINELKNYNPKKPIEDNLKISKEFKVLINYLAIKNKFLTDKEYFESNGFIISDFENQKRFSENIFEYNKLPLSFFSDKKKEFLTSLQYNNIKLLNRVTFNYYNFSELVKLSERNTQKPGHPVGFVNYLGVDLFGEENFSFLKTDSSWNFDVSNDLKSNYNLIWESPTVCFKKPGTGEKLPITDCVETKDVQSSSLNLDLLPDGAVLGLYVCKQEYVDIDLKNLEYTHLGIYIGKNQYNSHLFAHMGNHFAINELSDFLNIKCNNGYNNEILRVYIPKNTGINNIKDLESVNFKKELLQPITWIDLNIKKSENIEEEIKNNLGYPELKSQIYDNYYGLKFLNQAKQHLGTKYVFSGRNKYALDNGFKLKDGIDCVGLLYVVFRDLGYIDGSTACKEMFENGCAILDFIDNKRGHINGQGGSIKNKNDLEQLLPGDLLFLNTKSGGMFGHAAFYLGKENGIHKYIHASSGYKKVIIEDLDDKLDSKSLNFPFHYVRVTNLDTKNIDCSKNYISYYKRTKECGAATNYYSP